MKEWILTVSTVCLIATVLETFLSEGNTKKYVVGFLRLGLVLLMLAPLVNLIKKPEAVLELLEAEETVPASETIRTDYFRALAEKRLNEQGVYCTVALTKNDRGETEFVDIYLQEPVISEKEGNIYKNSKTVIDTLETYLGAEKEQVRVWGK